MATRHTYPTQSIFRNYALSITGILASLICLFWFDSILLIDFVFIGFIGLCMVAVWRSLLRQRAMVMCDEYNITLKDVGQVKLEWHKIDKIRLAFYALRSDQQDGWMRLTLKSEHKSIKIDSQIEKFYTLAERAARAAHINGLAVDSLTRHNFRVLGLSYPEWDAQDAARQPHGHQHIAPSKSRLYRIAKPRLRPWEHIDKFR